MNKKKDFTAETLFWLRNNKCPLNEWSFKTEDVRDDGKRVVKVEYVIPNTKDYVKDIKKQVDDKLQAIMKGGHFSDDG